MYTRDIFFNYRKTLKSFYSKLQINFKNIDENKINNLKEIAKKLNFLYNNKNFAKTKVERHTKVMELIYTNCGTNKDSKSPFRTDLESEKILLYMFSVDPNFEAAIIAGSCNTKDEIKEKLELYFGLCDFNLIKIENYYIKHFLKLEKQNEINEEIDKRVYK